MCGTLLHAPPPNHEPSYQQPLLSDLVGPPVNAVLSGPSPVLRALLTSQGHSLP